ncbi:MAG: ABC transporter permease [Thermoflexales bacterium]
MGAERVTRIAPRRGLVAIDIGELWHHRELLWVLAGREVKGRYRQMALGASWIVIQPIINMIVLSFIFGGVAKLPSGGFPYPVFTFVALLPWQLFASGVRSASQSLVQQQAMISKVYFPRLILPLASILAAGVDYAASLAVLGLLLLGYGLPLRSEMLLYIPISALAALCALGVGLWLAGLSARYRDVALGVQFLLPIWQYLTPVAYAGALVTGSLAGLYQLLNPMTPIIESSRWAMLGIGAAPGLPLLVALLTTVVLVITGAIVFRQSERNIVDVL